VVVVVVVVVVVELLFPDYNKIVGAASTASSRLPQSVVLIVLRSVTRCQQVLAVSNAELVNLVVVVVAGTGTSCTAYQSISHIASVAELLQVKQLVPVCS